MKINLKTAEFTDRAKAQQISDFIGWHLSADAQIKDGAITLIDDSGDYSQVDLFELGERFGGDNERAKWNAPEKIGLFDADEVQMFKTAIESYSRESNWQVEGIEFEKHSPDSDRYWLVFKFPQKLQCIYGIFTRFARIEQTAAK